MSVAEIMAELDENEDLHLARLLILINAFSGKKGDKTIDGLTKLAKLDFLLRYPVYLERALAARRADPDLARVEDYERWTVESRMVRFKFGPWDFRYRRFLNELMGRGLASVQLHGRTFRIGLTNEGRTVADRLARAEAFEPVADRAKALHRHCDLTATNLMQFVYNTFPEIGTLRLGEEIQ